MDNNDHGGIREQVTTAFKSISRNQAYKSYVMQDPNLPTFASIPQALYVGLCLVP